MAEARRGCDFRAVVDAVWEELLDDLELVPLMQELEQSKVFRRSDLRDLHEKNPYTTDKIRALLQLVKDEDYIKYDKFKQCLRASGQERLVEKLDAAERGEYKSAVRKKPRTEEERLFEVLKEDLIANYRAKESTMSVAPLIEQHEVELTKFYVRSPMIAYNKPNAFGQIKQSEEKPKQKTYEEKTRIWSYRELLLNGNDPYRGVYVTADAGMGKTIFAKCLAIKWCEAHTKTVVEAHLVVETSFILCDDEKHVSGETEGKGNSNHDSFQKPDSGAYLSHVNKPVTDDSSGSETDDTLYDNDDVYNDSLTFDDDMDILENFEYLFLIKLREYQGSDKCMLDDMILEMLKSKLKHKTCYSEEFLQKVLCNKRCMIVVDGLDEWTHPQSCRREEVIPHRTAWPGCTVLTTTRPWKLSTARLSKSDIDRQVEISQLDKTTARELESRAIEVLNKNQRQNDQVAGNSETKTVTDFKRSVPKKILGHIRYIPFVLLQMICLWFGNNPIGKSLCEVYSNIIELTLTRWLVKTDSGHTVCKCEPSVQHANIEIKCMKGNTHSQCYMPLFLKIGQLAFSTLFNVIRKETLLFDRRQVLKYLNENDLKQCLDMGLLSQVKDTTSLTEVRLQLYFPHKTLHEFFCALFIATNWNNADTGTMSIKQTISNKCTSVCDILDISEVLVFVCGLNPEVYSDISRPFATIANTDQSVIDYRNDVEYYLLLIEDSHPLKDYQRMQVSCFLESTRNQHPECKIVIEDMFISGEKAEYEQQALVKILSNSACSLNFLDISSYDETKGSSSAGGIVRILEQTEFSCLERLDVFRCGQTLLQNVLTSAAHTLEYLRLCEVSLTDDICSAISTLNNLRGLYLFSVQVSRGSMKVLTLPLLTEFTLLMCDLRDSTVTLTLPLLTEFTLDECDLRDSTVTLTLPLMTEIAIYNCDLRDSTVTLSTEMTDLETVELFMTTVSIPCYRELFLSISKLPQPITVKLLTISMTEGEWRELLFEILGKLPKSIHVDMQGCSGPSEEEWRNIFDVMKAFPAFCGTCTHWDLSGADIFFDTVV